MPKGGTADSRNSRQQQKGKFESGDYAGEETRTVRRDLHGAEVYKPNGTRKINGKAGKDYFRTMLKAALSPLSQAKRQRCTAAMQTERGDGNYAPINHTSHPSIQSSISPPTSHNRTLPSPTSD
jgi:hypothetical protein